MKVSTQDCIKLLRAFNITGSGDDTSKKIERLNVSNPSPTNVLASFRYKKDEYGLLFDDTAEDDELYITEQILKEMPGRKGSLVKNPLSSVQTCGMPYKGKDCYLFHFNSTQRRLDSYLATTYPNISRSSWQKNIKDGYITINGKIVTQPSTEVDIDSNVQTNLPDAPDYSTQKLSIIYKDDSVVVVNKPAGLLTHAKNPRDHEFTIAEFLRPLSLDDGDPERPGIVHRLDRETSGVLIGARTLQALDFLKQQFASRKVEKIYYAVVDGIPKQKHAIIDLPIARSSAKPGTFKVAASGKLAQTEYTVLQTNGKHSLVELRPRTGRTHQIRVHMAYIGTPVHGDAVYGKPADRMYLHAFRLVIALPTSKILQSFNAPVPPEFNTLTKS